MRDYQQGVVSGPTLVPNETLAQFLQNVLKDTIPHMPKIQSLWDFARTQLPTEAKVAPIGMEKVLASLLAQDFHRVLPSQVPGIYLNIIRHILELRRRHINLPSFDGIPWPRLLEWLDDIWPDALYDECRVYQYASRSQVVTTDHSTLAIYGYVEAHASQWQLFDALSQHYSITVYIPWLMHYDNSVGEDWLNQWRKRGAVCETLSNEGSSPQQSVVQVRPGTLLLETILGQIQARPGEDLLVVLGGMDPVPLMQLARRRGIRLAEKEPIQYHAKNVWRTFWRLVQGEGDGADRSLWLESVAAHGREENESLDFVRTWGFKVKRVKSWQELGELVHQAVMFHGMEDLTRALASCGDWTIYDDWSLPPRTPLVEELWDLLPFKRPWSSGEGIPWAQGVNARMLTASTIIVAFLQEGRFPRGVTFDSLWIPELTQLYGLPGPEHDREQDLYLLHLLRESAVQEICWIAPQPSDETRWWPTGIEPDREAAGMEAMSQVGPVSDARSIRHRYRSHYDDEVFDAYQGDIGPELSQRLWPEKVTPSALEQFGVCPLAFFYEHILGIKPLLEDNQRYTVSSAVKGQWMHKVLETAVKATTAVNAEMMRQWVEDTVQSLAPTHRILPAALRHAKDAVLQDLFQVWPLIRFQTEGVGVQTEYDLEWEVPIPSGTWRFHGRIDRVDHIGDGTIMIVDYKTGNLKNPDRVAADNLQLPLYVQGLRQRFPGTGITAQLQGISSNNQFRTHILSLPETASHPQELVNEMAARMRRGEFFPLPRLNQDPCRICSFVLMCPADIKAIRRRKRPWQDAYWQIWED